jgi:hypothetical protein
MGSITKFQYLTQIKTTDDLHCRGKSIPEQLIFTQPKDILWIYTIKINFPLEEEAIRQNIATRARSLNQDFRKTL